MEEKSHLMEPIKNCYYKFNCYEIGTRNKDKKKRRQSQPKMALHKLILALQL